MGRLCPKPPLERSVYSLSPPAGAGLRISRFGLDLLPEKLLTVLLPTTDDQAAGPDVKDSPFGITQQRDTSPGSLLLLQFRAAGSLQARARAEGCQDSTCSIRRREPTLATTVLVVLTGVVRPGLFRLCPYIGDGGEPAAGQRQNRQTHGSTQSAPAEFVT